MSYPQSSQKAFISSIEMAEMLSLSESRFVGLMKAGVFPRPVRHEGCKRPVFNLELQSRCLEIRRTGIDCPGRPVLFNRKRRKSAQPKPRQNPQPVTEEQAELIESLKSLGLTATGEDVQAALRELFPSGSAGIEQGEVVRKVFRYLRGRK